MDSTLQQGLIFTLGEEAISIFIATTTQVTDDTTTTITTDAIAVEDIITAEEGAAIIETEATEAIEDATREHAEEAIEVVLAVALAEAEDVVVVVADN
ncbi:MAG: hypothetical protein ChlgKO_04530 [Chlamydiales bacterium]